jgi:hypothetical protein
MPPALFIQSNGVCTPTGFHLLSTLEIAPFHIGTHSSILTTTSESQFSTIEGRNGCKNECIHHKRLRIIIHMPQSPKPGLGELSNLSHFVKVKQ